jgi:hypothetical protein
MIQIVELSPKMIERLKEQPIIESAMFLSENKEWFIHKTTITDIKSTKYVDKVMGYLLGEEKKEEASEPSS